MTARAEALLLDGFGVQEVRHQLLDEFDASAVPAIRTISNLKAALRTADTLSWSSDNSPPEAARLVLAVIKGRAIETDGAQAGLTRVQAEEIARLSVMAPGMPAHIAFMLATAYISRRHRGDAVADLDLLVAFAPWTPPNHREYLDFLRTGRAPVPPTYILQTFIALPMAAPQLSPAQIALTLGPPSHLKTDAERSQWQREVVSRHKKLATRNTESKGD